VKIFLFRLLLIVILSYIVVTAIKIIAFVVSFYIGLINILHFSCVLHFIFTFYIYILHFTFTFYILHFTFQLRFWYAYMHTNGHANRESCLVGPRIELILRKFSHKHWDFARNPRYGTTSFSTGTTLKNGYWSAEGANVVYKPAYSIEIQGCITVSTKRCHYVVLQSILINQVFFFFRLVDCVVCKQYKFSNSVPQTCVSHMVVHN
jgi:hypothetical protein